MVLLWRVLFLARCYGLALAPWEEKLFFYLTTTFLSQNIGKRKVRTLSSIRNDFHER